MRIKWSVLRKLHDRNICFLKRPCINPLKAELNPIRRLLALVGVRHNVHVSRVRVNKQSVSELPTFFLLLWR